MKRLLTIISLGVLVTCVAKASTYAICIGINDYPDPKVAEKASGDSGQAPVSIDLKGCVNDATSYRSVLTDKYKVPSNNIELLLNSAATIEGLKKSLSRFVEKLVPGDTLVLAYSGHGTRVPEKDKALEPDGFIECLVLYDGLVADKSIRRLVDVLSEIGINVTVVLDCCYSGGMSRTTTRITRSILYKDAASFLGSSIKPASVSEYVAVSRSAQQKSGTVVFLCAGKENQPTSDLSFKDGSPSHGAFSLFFLAAIEMDHTLSLYELMRFCSKGLKDAKIDQIPDLQTTAIRKYEPFLDKKPE